MAENNFVNFTCPLPLPLNESVTIGHGSGGTLTKSLITSIFYKHFSNTSLDAGNDFALCEFPDGDENYIVVTSTDGHVVDPLFFPGGDIGRLAVAGTVNDVSMSGGIPKYLTASFIIEEGFPFKDLEKIVISMQACANEANVKIIAGDTKVVEKNKADKLFISTTGIGIAPQDLTINGSQAQEGDAVIISGSIGDHGIAVLAARNDLGFSTTVHSDVGPLNGLIQRALRAVPDIHVLRDPTRGGVATTLNEIAQQSRVEIILNEISLPVKPQVKAACDILGFDPLYVANEGKVLIFVPAENAAALLDELHADPLGVDACQIGYVGKKKDDPLVLMKTEIGGTRIVDMLSGQMLPRIC